MEISRFDEDGASDDEAQHKVTISNKCYLGAFGVTQSLYEKVMGANPSAFNDRAIEGDSSVHPVENVTWVNAVVFCKKLSKLPEEKKAGRVYRLPTEAEWEFACRAGSVAKYHCEEKHTSILRVPTPNIIFQTQTSSGLKTTLPAPPFSIRMPLASDALPQDTHFMI